MLRSRFHSLLAAATLGVCPGAAVGAQGVLLQMRPHAGDTLQVRMEQESELVGTRRTSSGETHSAVTTMLQVYSHAIVEGEGPTGAVLLTVTDSALVTTSEPAAGTRGKPVHVPVHREVRMRVAPNGSMRLADGEGDRHDDAELASLMPAAFPNAPVRVGDRWVREMMLPGVLGNGAAGVLHATFRLDSLGRGGGLAYVSMEGEMRPPESAAGAAAGAGGPSLDGGNVSGQLVLDRRRGWLSESRFSIDAHTTVTPPAALGGAAMRFRMRVTQRVKTLDRR